MGFLVGEQVRDVLTLLLSQVAVNPFVPKPNRFTSRTRFAAADSPSAQLVRFSLQLLLDRPARKFPKGNQQAVANLIGVRHQAKSGSRARIGDLSIPHQSLFAPTLESKAGRSR